MQRRLQSGRWVLLHPGVYRLRECLPSWEQSLLAACLWGGEGTMASHRAAARLWGLGIEEAAVEILAPSSTRARSGVVLHRTDSLSRRDIARADGIPVTSPTRTLIDLGAVTPVHVVERCLETALRERLTSIWYLAERLDQLGKPGRRGAGILRGLLRERDPRLAPTESELESLLWQLLSRSGLPVPERQVEVVDRDGLIGRLDFAYPEQRLAVEAIGLRYHSGDRVLNDAERRNRLIVAGWRVLEFPWRDVVRRGKTVISHIASALSASGVV